MGHHSVAVADVPPDREGNHIENMESDTEVSAHTDVDMKIFNTEEKRHMAVVDPSLFPDGGLRAWSVVAASFLLVFCTFGMTP
jgi:hypothetical protein